MRENYQKSYFEIIKALNRYFYRYNNISTKERKKKKKKKKKRKKRERVKNFDPFPFFSSPNQQNKRTISLKSNQPRFQLATALIL